MNSLARLRLFIVKWYSCYGKQYDISLKREKKRNYYLPSPLGESKDFTRYLYSPDICTLMFMGIIHNN